MTRPDQSHIAPLVLECSFAPINLQILKSDMCTIRYPKLTSPYIYFHQSQHQHQNQVIGYGKAGNVI